LADIVAKVSKFLPADFQLKDETSDNRWFEAHRRINHLMQRATAGNFDET